MATNRLRLILDTCRTNLRLMRWRVTVLDPLETYNDIVEQTIKDVPRLTPIRISHSRARWRQERRRAPPPSKRLSTSRQHASPVLTPMSAHMAPREPASTEKLDTRCIDFLLSHLSDRTPQEIGVFYNNETDDGRQVLEAATQTVGHIPRKSANGAFMWSPLPSRDDQREHHRAGQCEESSRRDDAAGVGGDSQPTRESGERRADDGARGVGGLGSASARLASPPASFE